ncbi:putative bifunctional diguanylate cyclase/phosphodiesterase [Rhizobium leguminosarum]|uniref:putative bifunctional diguanylate cyclase/phosphodiesterase n=1 Tax=Rhizobium leguminosarum TaxID=384 RepID=UPI00047815C7|nr:EAL domain-containing protein [Rhizobium leguminosarum]TBY28081.1 EAL domain-containing protein [Rhizobium leguminosarum bv. viciae]TBZ51369.1 EAL domain-containing protein [Rhizobium leguminosarum bv. viciae]TCA67791.1 EAL domain-containing protein [Rhizobium leguminosarum bv. viciae]TCB02524.1 EAL domain-containing protein [Rhizobium leguminosarum bv. viciae]TCB31511.1 EAL domain-containing protein [Rhizobium leguminosarum bv. viciae]
MVFRGLGLQIVLPSSSKTFQQSWIASGRILFLIAVSGLGAIGLVVLSALWAGTESDAAALDRQRQLVNARLREQVDQVAHVIGQFGNGYLTRVYPAARSSGGSSSLDAVLTAAAGSAISQTAMSAFGYDQAFVVDEKAQLLMLADAQTEKRYRWMKPLFLPLLQDARLGVRPGAVSNERTPSSMESRLASPGRSNTALANLMRLEGRPTIVGVVAINDPEEGQRQTMRQFLIVVRFIDGAALDELSRQQGLNGARFARTADADENEVAFQIDATANGEPIGFIVWRPDLPGSRVIGRLMPALSIAALVIAILFSVLLVRLRSSLGELRKSELHARQLALHDVLTSLPNRALFAMRFDECLAETKNSAERSAVALLDLDRFKAVNDTFGHAAGDELIRMAAERIHSLLRPGDTLARLGGDEFALLLRDIKDHDQVLPVICDAIVAELGKPFPLLRGEAVARVGGSIGVTVVPDAGRNADDIMRYADVALYEAKMGGRGQWRVYSPSMDGGRNARDILKNELREVLAKGTASSADGPQSDPIANKPDFGSLEVYYQTVHRAEGGGYSASGAEALVRWRHSQRGLLTPASFIPVAEEGGLIDALGFWVLREACRAACKWPENTFVAVNVSPAQLRRPNFAEEVFAVLQESGLPPSRLELELTESSLIEDNSDVYTVLKSLRSQGVQISLDDFGTGFSCLSHLLRFDIDRIKIDRSFVSQLGTKANGAAIIGAIVALSRNLGISTTAEGVETEYQRDFLAALGCTDLQGYFFSKPVPLRELDSFRTAESAVA